VKTPLETQLTPVVILRTSTARHHNKA